MRRLAPILVLLAVAALATVALAQVEDAPAARATTITASGSFEVTNSDDGQPIFAATDIAPGGSAEGTVTIEDTGSEAAAIVLRRGQIEDTPGTGGGVLSDRLRLNVVDVTAPGAPHIVYRGPLASMPEQQAGDLTPGEARTFEFTATLPDGGEPDVQNAVQGASTTVAYTWIAAEPTQSGGGAEEGGGGLPGGGAGTGTSPGPDSAGGRRAALSLTVPRFRRALRRGRLVVWANCDEPCRLSVRGRVRATTGGRHRSARVRFTQKRFVAAGPQRLRIPIPPRLRRWLRHEPPPRRLRARLRFIAVGTDGRRAAVRKTVPLRVRRH
jgi:hypothetical protein